MNRWSDDDPPLFLFDGHCVLCSRGVSWLMKHDWRGKLRFASAQSALGRELFARFGEDSDATYLLVVGGKAYGRSDGYLKMCGVLGGPWQLCRVAGLVPRRLRDAAYDWLARNRYRLFGTTAEQCALLTQEQRTRLVG